MKREYKTVEYPYNQEYNGMYSVSTVKRIFSHGDSLTVMKEFSSENHSFDLRNENHYDRDSKELTVKAKQWVYNSEFLRKLSLHITILDIAPFLSHQLNNSASPDKLLLYIKAGAMLSDKIPDSIKVAINDWLSGLQNKASNQKSEGQKDKLSMSRIALRYVYSGTQITRENGNLIAKEYGHNSGEKLFQKYSYYSSTANRKGRPNPCTPKKLNNKIKLIESVVELLPTDKQQRAKDEVSVLKKIHEAEYQ